MSEYQRYEFLAIDRTLTEKEMAALRGISTRAKITPRGFWNEYHWGDPKADPARCWSAISMRTHTRRTGGRDA